jgi:glycogen(starch) synthase
MNVLLVNPAYAPFIGGAESYTQAIAERLHRDGYKVQVVTSDAAEVETFWNPCKPRFRAGRSIVNGVAVQRVRLAHLPASPLSFYVLRRVATTVGLFHGTTPLLRLLAPWMPRLPGLSRNLRQFQEPFDLVHGINIALEWPLIAAWKHARSANLPFVATPFMHVGEPGATAVSRNYDMPHQLEPLRDADAVIAQTTIERDFLVRRGVAAERIHVHGMGIALEQVQGGNAEAFRRTYSVKGPIVLFLGVVTKDKGCVHLIEAMRLLWAAGIESTLVIAGKPVAEFEQYWRTLPGAVTRRIVLTGVVLGQAKRDLLAATTLFALPSRIDSFGAVYLEAWANGIPVIGSRAGGVPAVIDDGKDGLLVAYGAVNELAAAIRRLLGDADLRYSLGAAGQSKVTARYTWDRIIAQLYSLYAGTIAVFPSEHGYA